MNRMVFVNLPVSDLDRSRAFFTALGFTINEDFSDETAASVVISEEIVAMLLTEEKFRGFAGVPAADPAAGREVIVALSCSSRDEVDTLADAALAAGAGRARPAEDLGFMYQRSFLDPDGHLWEVAYMDLSQMS
ncbi:VOC family protein [Nocardiopsis coralliicola]